MRRKTADQVMRAEQGTRTAEVDGKGGRGGVDELDAAGAGQGSASGICSSHNKKSNMLSPDSVTLTSPPTPALDKPPTPTQPTPSPILTADGPPTPSDQSPTSIMDIIMAERTHTATPTETLNFDESDDQNPDLTSDGRGQELKRRTKKKERRKKGKKKSGKKRKGTAPPTDRAITVRDRQGMMTTATATVVACV